MSSFRVTLEEEEEPVMSQWCERMCESDASSSAARSRDGRRPSCQGQSIDQLISNSNCGLKT